MIDLALIFEKEPMSFKQAMMLGLGLLLAGIYTLTTHRDNARQHAQKAKESRYYKWFKFDYSEGYFRALLIWGGLLLIDMGLITLLSAFVSDKTDNTHYSFIQYIIMVLLIGAFVGAFVFVIYMTWQSVINSKKHLR